MITRSARITFITLSAFVAAACDCGGSHTKETDVLVQITQDDNAAAPVTLNGANVTSAFRAVSTPNTRVGLVTGLVLGANTISAGAVSLTIRNYPITGPITSGPHDTPFFCQTQDVTLPDGTKFGAPTDADCSAPTKITYLYMRPAEPRSCHCPARRRFPECRADHDDHRDHGQLYRTRRDRDRRSRHLSDRRAARSDGRGRADVVRAAARMEQAADCHRGLRLSRRLVLQGASIGNLTLAASTSTS